MDLYEEVAQQGQAPPLSPAYIPDPMELDEHVPVYVPEPEHPEYHVPSDDDIQMTIDHTDYPADGEDGDDEPSNDDDDDKDEDPTEDEEEEEHLALTDSSAVPFVNPVPSAGDTEAFETDEARKTVKLEPPMSASMEARIAAHAALPIPPTNPAYDQAPLGRTAAMIRMRDNITEEDMPPQRRFVLTAPPPGCDVAESSAVVARPPRGQYDFVDTVEVGQGLICSPGHDAWTITRAAERAEDVGYVRPLQASEHKMMTSIKEVNLRVSYEAQKLETHMSHIEWQRQSAEDLVVKQIMRTHVLEARARIDIVDDASSSC
ncbi:hypothetical protein Tco_1297601 [Tanacetum coccineum]